MASPLPVRVKGDSNINLVAMAASIRSLPAIVVPRLVSRLAFTYPSVRQEEYFVHVNAVPKARKWTEERAGGVIATIKQTVVNDTYEVSMAISGDDWADDQIGLYTPLAQEMMARLLLAPDELITTNLISVGTTITGYDGVAFYGTTHVWPNGEYTTAQINYNSGSGTDAEDIQADFYTALAAMQGWKDDRGVPKQFQPAFESAENIVIHHSLALMQPMQQVFDLSKGGQPFNIQSPVATTGIPSQSRAAGLATRVPDANLSGNSWYIHFTGGVMPVQRPFVFLDREAPNVTILSKGSEHYDKYNEVLILGKRRFGLGVLRPESSQQVYNA